MSDLFPALTAMVGQLVSAIPEWGPPLSGTIAFLSTRQSELRFEQLEQFIQDIDDRVNALGAEKLSRAWLGSHEGKRVVLGLGEAAMDLLRQEKVRLLAGAAVASAALDPTWKDQRRRFAFILADADIEVLSALYVLALDFKDRTEPFNLKFTAYAKEVRERRRPVAITAEIAASVDEFVVRDAVAALQFYRLADAVDRGTRADGTPTISSIRPRPVWPEFAAYLIAATDEPGTSAT